MKMMSPPNSAATSLPCLASLGHLTADKRLRYAPPKFVSQTSFIRKPLYEIARMTRIKILNAVCLYGKHGIQKEEFGSESIKER
ncbi:MAG: hypothetical protein COS08_03385 [Euryarchaeota archaeon CG01_land_8_20_14_3_00_38_12]|nr:MAG: hypothetical protein COS08_03385 [Euryarchaeota archaeon CG01_land_8_20_14_3_00_38_12]